VTFVDDGPWYPGTEVELSGGEILSEMRKIYSMSQTELAERSGVSQSNISAIEAGRIGLGGVRARRFASAFGVPAGVFLP